MVTRRKVLGMSANPLGKKGNIVTNEEEEESLLVEAFKRKHPGQPLTGVCVQTGQFVRSQR